MSNLELSAERFRSQIATTATLGDALELLAAEVQSTLGYRKTWYGVLSADRKSFRVLAAELSGGEDLWDSASVIPIEGDPFVTRLLETGEVQIVEDAQTDPDVNREIVEQLGNRTIVNVPMHVDHIGLWGCLGTGTFGDEGVRVPTEEEVAYLRELADATAASTVRILAAA